MISNKFLKRETLANIEQVKTEFSSVTKQNSHFFLEYKDALSKTSGFVVRQFRKHELNRKTDDFSSWFHI